MLATDRQTGYPSVDKPWMKWYPKGTENLQLPDCTLFDYIWQKNKDHLSDVALVYYGKEITYKQLFSLIDNATNKMNSLGIKKGDTVAFISLYTPEMIAVFYAINRIGAVCCMMDPRTAPDSLAKYIKTANAKCLLVQDTCSEVADKVLEIAGVLKTVILHTASLMGRLAKVVFSASSHISPLMHEHIDFEQIITNNQNIVNDCISGSGTLPAMICYTGGTTGESKGVVLSNNNINSISEQYGIATGGFERQQKWLTPSVPFVAYITICSLHSPLSYGMQCFIELYDYPKMKQMITKNRINHLFVIPSFYEYFFTDDCTDYSYIIMPTSGGDKLSEKTYNAINNALKNGKSKSKICNGYGMTEVSSGACVTISDGCNKAGSVGIPFSHTVVTAFNPETGDEAKVGEQGEICISGPGVMLGYLNDDEATKKVIRTHHGCKWMHTGDLGHIDSDGCVFIDGRIKRLIVKHDGFKVFPAFIEEKLLKCELIKDISCVGMNDKVHGTGQVPIVFYIAREDSMESQVIEKILREKSLEYLPEYSQPYEYKKINELPRTKIGKIDYRKLESSLL